jgi:preprotein translocase subunit SecY
MLATITIVPNFIESTLILLNGLSTTSLLILAGVVLDLIREINIYYSNVYNNINKIKIII